MTGVIIAGGFGTRLRPLTYYRPKHLLPVANRPFLEYQVSLLKRHGIRKIVFASNYLWEQIHAHFGDGSAFGVAMEYALEPEPLGTAGAIRNAAKRAAGDRLLVLNGDVLTDFDLGEIVSFHETAKAVATIAARPAARPHAYGVLPTDESGRVREWREPSEEEKKRVATGEGQAEPGSDLINAGIYVLEPGLIARIPEGRPVSIERETYPEAILDGIPVYAAVPEGYWLDIGNPTQYRAANEAMVSGKARTDLILDRISDSATVDSTATLDEVSSLGVRSTVGPLTVIERSLLLEDARVGANCRITGAILDRGATIEDGCVLEEGAVVEAGSVVARGSTQPMRER